MTPSYPKPHAFESLVVLLLQKMGYGGEIKQSGLVTPYSNDGGIDGIIKEDVLGFGRIHIQAKRYALENSVQRQEIQSFVGALAVAQSNKGVFITTSSFSRGAIQYAVGLNGSTTLILIDGQKLAEYIYEYGVGLQVEHTVEIKNSIASFGIPWKMRLACLTYSKSLEPVSPQLSLFVRRYEGKCFTTPDNQGNSCSK